MALKNVFDVVYILLLLLATFTVYIFFGLLAATSHLFFI